MEIIHTVAWMKQVAREARRKDRILGLVPTMGALHEGHFHLVEEAKRRSSSVVVSIFVNPKQFGPSEDFQKYPRALDADRTALEKMQVDYLFAPSPDEMYPKDFRTTVVVGGLSECLEGKSRPAHFRGVTTVVLKLFEIVQPHCAFFGRKDAQQVRIISQMVSDLNLDVEIVICPIVREAEGLARSSRNSYLSQNERQKAAVLYRALLTVSNEIQSGERSPDRLLSTLSGVISREPDVKLDYAEVVDAETFEPITALSRSSYILVAAKVGNTRLIDNALVELQDKVFTVSI